MIIKNIKLKNIRSYINQEIRFENGITLLSGDIGSGKSTILLAIDFALFGLRKGYLSGNALLRNGEIHGSVELCFDVDGKEVTIKRNLKKNSNAISQDYGTLMLSEKEKELSAIELKQFVINLLNYPKEYLTKSKYFIYNYTIYTPQEEMKQILLGEKEYRLDTIRKVFGIDRYKRAKENSKLLCDFLKIKKREFLFITEKYHENILEKEKTENNIENNYKYLAELKNKIELINEQTKKFENDILKVDEQINELNNLKKQLEIKEIELNYKTKQIIKNENDYNILDKEINALNSELKNEFDFNIEEKKEKDKLVKKLNNDLNELKSKITEINTKKSASLSIIKSIEKLDKCPTCRQNVSKEYKNDIFNEENEKIKAFENELNLINENINNVNKEFLISKEELDNLIRKESSFELFNLKKKNLHEKISKLEEIKKQDTIILSEKDKLNKDIDNLKSNIVNFSDLDVQYKKLKEELNKHQKEQKELEVKEGIIENEIINLNKEIEKLKNEIEFMNQTKKKYTTYNLLHGFLENNFVNILDTIEKKVMLKIKSEFNNFFQKWFNMLIEGEIIKVSLDDEFSPVIEQAGHEIEYVNLSGGEKTAAALAYRLALNQIINTFVSEIKTKDILILDEPTDGFSSEQLDRLRFVLQELKINQIIIVSHESKIESFVDRIIRLDKLEHITRIV